MKVFILVFVALGLGLLWHESNYPHSEIRDSDEYVDLALNLERHGIHYAGVPYDFKKGRDLRLYSKRTPAYPVFLGINSNSSFSIFRFLQMGFLLLIFLIGLSFLRDFGLTDRTSLSIYSVLSLLNIPLFFTLTFRLSDLMLASVVAVFTFTLYRYLKTPQAKLLKFCSMLLVIAVLIKPVVWPFILLWSLFLLARSLKRPVSILNVMPLFALVMFCWLNYYNTGVFHFSSISTINKAQYNGKLMLAQSEGLHSSDSFMNSERFSIPRSESEFKEYRSSMNGLFYSAVQKNPLAYIKVHITGMIKMLVDPGRYEIYTYLGTETSKTELTPMLYAGQWNKLFSELQKNGTAFYLLFALSVLSVLKLVFAVFGLFKTNKPFLVISLVLFVYFLGVTGPVGAFRFAIPLQMFLVLLATIGLSTTLHSFKKRPK